ncbi:MAG: LysR substrate-binding domain-containing protein [Bacteroidales bacterium]|jgi:LysR family transcriptional regulator, transcriptional activator of the cysJI operon|nr:LysR substrate-binding domain-containing protein [Bacteroidales bacterium]MDD3160629.1 LysR substrate-binding domain-containing protein [Bacteroidales bacterium]
MILDFRLKVFNTVVNYQSFSKAAIELCITQPAVTKHISELEKQIGSPLFIRHGSKISITPQGEILHRYAQRILGLYRDLNNEFASEKALCNGEIRIGASTTISQYILPVILAKFKSRYPLIAVELISGNSREIERLAAEREIDLGLIEGNSNIATLHYDTFIKDEIVLVTSVANNRSCKDEISCKELSQLPFVFRENGSGTLDVIDAALQEKGIQRRDLHIQLYLDSSESIKRYLLQSATYAFISIAAVTDELKDNKLRIVDVADLEISRDFRFVSLHGSYGKLIEMFRTFCLSNYN